MSWSSVVVISTDEKIDFIKSSKLFEWVNEHDLWDIAEFSQKQECDDGYLFFEQWDTSSNSIYIIISWNVKVMRNEKEIGSLDNNAVFWEMGVLWNKARIASVYANWKIEVLVIPWFLLMQYIDQHNEFKNTFFNIIKNRKNF